MGGKHRRPRASPWSDTGWVGPGHGAPWGVKEPAIPPTHLKNVSGLCPRIPIGYSSLLKYGEGAWRSDVGQPDDLDGRSPSHHVAAHSSAIGLDISLGLRHRRGRSTATAQMGEMARTGRKVSMPVQSEAPCGTGTARTRRFASARLLLDRAVPANRARDSGQRQSGSEKGSRAMR